MRSKTELRDEDERAFVHRFAELQGDLDARMALMGTTLVAIACLVTAFAAAPEIQSAGRIAFGSILAVHLAWPLVVRRFGWSIRSYAFFVQIFSIAAQHALLYYALTHLTVPIRVLLAPGIFCGLTAMTVLGCWSTRLAAVAAVFALALTSITYWSIYPTLIPVAAGAYLCGLLLQIGILARRRGEASREYRYRKLLAPSSVVKRSLNSKSTLVECFSPKLRSCVCLSTDLRRYAAVESGRELNAIGDYLSRVYARSESLLRDHLPDGNYYADWIAGELFVVVYLEDGADEREVVTVALRLAREMLSPGADQDEAVAADIGLAFGVAFIGMMGPPSSRKATALGETPGRARRLQGCGPMLRAHRGNESACVIFGRDVQERLIPDEDGTTAGRFLVDSTARVRDLDDATLFFVDAEASRDAVAPGGHDAAV